MHSTLALALATVLSLPLLAEPEPEKASLPSSDPSELKADGFTPLFNGKDLEGWSKVGGTGEFKAEDNCVVGFGQNIRGNTFLRTDKTYGDFILVFEFQFIDPSGNSGCQFRSAQQNGDGRVFGYQCEHDSNKDRSFTAGIYDEARRGWLYPGIASKNDLEETFTAQGQRLFKWDDWNRIVIHCKDHHIQTWLNGELRADFEDLDEKQFTPEGFIALQVHGGKSAHVRWKNIFLKPL
ncbi:MAG: DUF1080 domain-containing protein [Verrucomicrobia bacterium]|nr:DUF1080 domain-containing protein [Verrucomicrobiota bacterium]MDA1006636.1 DUF1080 domain-containing protein [Verrucomicrobiota bacterium]